MLDGDLDPFIMMDQMGEVEYAPYEPRGTSWHPHRGFETVTYMIDGKQYIALMDKVTLPRTYLGHEKFQEFLIGMEKSLEPTLEALGLLKKK